MSLALSMLRISVVNTRCVATSRLMDRRSRYLRSRHSSGQSCTLLLRLRCSKRGTARSHLSMRIPRRLIYQAWPRGPCQGNHDPSIGGVCALGGRAMWCSGNIRHTRHKVRTSRTVHSKCLWDVLFCFVLIGRSEQRHHCGG